MLSERKRSGAATATISNPCSRTSIREESTNTVRQPPVENEPTDPTSLDGISVELNRNGVWIEVRHANGSWDAAFLTASCLRWLAGASFGARSEAYELLRKSALGTES